MATRASASKVNSTPYWTFGFPPSSTGASESSLYLNNKNKRRLNQQTGKWLLGTINAPSDSIHLTSRRESFLMLTRLLRVFTGSWGAGVTYGNWCREQEGKQWSSEKSAMLILPGRQECLVCPSSPAQAYFQGNSGPYFLQRGIPQDVECQTSLLPWKNGSQSNSLRKGEKNDYEDHPKKHIYNWELSVSTKVASNA